MGRKCSTYGGFGVEIKGKETTSEDQGIDGRRTQKWILKKWNGGGHDWIDLAQDRNGWQTLVNAIISLRVP